MGRKNSGRHFEYSGLSKHFCEEILKNNSSIKKEQIKKSVTSLKNNTNSNIRLLNSDEYRVNLKRTVFEHNVCIPSLKLYSNSFDNVDRNKIDIRILTGIQHSYKRYYVNNTGKWYMYLIIRQFLNKDEIVGIVVYNNKEAYRIAVDCDITTVLVELFHFGFYRTEIIGLFNLASDYLENFVIKPFVTLEDYLFVLNYVPISVLNAKDILEYIQTDMFKISITFPELDVIANRLQLSTIEALECIKRVKSIYPKFNYQPKNNISYERKKSCSSDNNGILQKTDVISSNILNNSFKDNLEVEENKVVKQTEEKGIEKIELDILKMYNFSESELLYLRVPLNFKIKENYSDEEVISFILANIERSYLYTSDFYPAEDKILELYYKDVGTRVVEIMKAVIPNYIEKSKYDYMWRVRELKVKTPHPVNSFGICRLDELVFYTIGKQVKSRAHKYLPWVDLFDLSYYFKKQGLSGLKTVKNKELLDLETVDIQKYIKSASKLKEVVYHDVFWTSTKHSIFKEKFKTLGLKIIGYLPGLTEEDCLKHSLKYKIYQNYTDEEVVKMKEVYLQSGLQGLVSTFTYRTEKALKYKVEEEGWDREEKEFSNEDFEDRVRKEVEFRTQVEIAEYKNKFYDKVQKEIEDKIRKKVRNEEVKAIETEVINRLRKSLERDIEIKLRKELSVKIKEEERQRLNSELNRLIRTTFKDELDIMIHLILKDCTLKELPIKFPNTLIEMLKNSLLEQITYLYKK